MDMRLFGKLSAPMVYIEVCHEKMTESSLQRNHYFNVHMPCANELMIILIKGQRYLIGTMLDRIWYFKEHKAPSQRCSEMRSGLTPT